MPGPVCRAASKGALNRRLSTYVGRFAPTPSGPLHLGSLLTAVASWLDARSQGGRWRLRIDDLDTPRVAPGAEDAIVAALVAHGLRWDGPIVRQSRLREHHRAALARLRRRTFACRCARRDLRGLARYPGTCRHLNLPTSGNAVRIRADGRARPFTDRVQGRCAAGVVDDFVVWRRDDMAAYPLAVVADDQAMGVTHVVRGADLLDETPRQLRLISHLGGKPPAYAHIPVLATATGEKLSKHNDATAIDDRAAARNVVTALCLLGMAPPSHVARPAPLLDWARERWRIDRVPRARVLAGFVALE